VGARRSAVGRADETGRHAVIAAVAVLAALAVGVLCAVFYYMAKAFK
jgi:ABC-type proline/glycine betaine transport system permease subunit